MNLLMLSGDTALARGEDGAFYQMLRRFSTSWDRIDIICPPGGTPRTIYENVHVHPSTRHLIFQPLFIRSTGKRLFAERDYDLIVSHDFGVFYNGIGAWMLSGYAPVVSEIHHVEGYPVAVTPRERLYRLLARAYIRWAKRYVAAFRAVNRTGIPGLMRSLGVPEEKILVLPSLYIDFEIFHPTQELKHYDVLFVGRLASNKGIFTLLDAIVQVKKTHPEVRVCIVGRGALQESMLRRIQSLQLQNNITHIPHVETPEDLARLYNQARMLVCASTAEGGPRVTIEAMACAVPVISTRVGVMPDVIHDGVNGLLIGHESSMLAQKIRLLLDDSTYRKKIGAAGNEAVQAFQAEKVIARYAQGYHDLIARTKKA